MKQIKLVGMIGLMIFLFVACSNAEESYISQWEVPDTEFPLAEPGPYFAGVRVYSIIDESRASREIKLYIWYPAKEENDTVSTRDAPAYQNDAPYPLILTGSDTGGSLFGDHLVSHGYVMAIVEPPTAVTYRWDYQMIDNARDLLFVLDQLADNPPEGLEGIIDTDHVGVAGYSGDGDTAFAVSGARLDPEFYQLQCEQLPEMVPNAVW